MNEPPSPCFNDNACLALPLLVIRSLSLERCSATGIVMVYQHHPSLEREAISSRQSRSGQALATKTGVGSRQADLTLSALFQGLHFNSTIANTRCP